MEKVCCTLIRFTAQQGNSQLNLSTLNLSWLRSCIQDHPKQSCGLTFKTIEEPTVSTPCASSVLTLARTLRSSQNQEDYFAVRHLITLTSVFEVILKDSSHNLDRRRKYCLTQKRNAYLSCNCKKNTSQELPKNISVLFSIVLMLPIRTS